MIGLALAACGDNSGTSDFDAPGADSAGPIPPGEDLIRDIVSTDLAVDLAAMTATATITLAPSSSQGASFEIGDLEVTAVRHGTTELQFADRGDQIDIGVPATTEPLVLAIDYRFLSHNGFNGADPDGFTFVWPYYCGNLFPCHSAPPDGTTFRLALTGVPDGSVAVYPTSIDSPAPSYQIAWAISAYNKRELGTTTAGTKVSVWYRDNETTAATRGTRNLVAAFDWLEQTLGPYHFGAEVGPVSITWGPGAYGGMEHHPTWHVGAPSLGSQEVNVHEAAHGWFGDGIRIACWEDFVLSEGTATYLAGRALEVVAPQVGQSVWNSYRQELNAISPTDPVWPDSCGAIDILDDNLFTNAPYMRGAYFYRGVALKVGADVLDQALGAFYTQYAGQPAKMSDMLRVIQEETGYDPTACAQSWLRSTTIPPIGPCP